MTFRCPHCRKKIGTKRVRRWSTKLTLRSKEIRTARVSSRHPETSREAAAEVTRSGRGAARAVIVARYIRKHGGVTDDEIDERFGWGHQSTSAVMSNMRRAGVLRFSNRTRKTRKGRRALVNVLIE